MLSTRLRPGAALACSLTLLAGVFVSLAPLGASDADSTHTVSVHGLAMDGVAIPFTPTFTPTPNPTATPTVQPLPFVVPYYCNNGRVLHYIPGWLYSFPSYAMADAGCVAMCESTWNPAAENGPYKGLFQAQRSWFERYGFDYWQWADPFVNAQMAANIYAEFGWYYHECKP